MSSKEFKEDATRGAAVDAVLQKAQQSGAAKVVFHCGKSQFRGPSSANFFKGASVYF